VGVADPIARLVRELARLPGIGARRAASIGAALTQMLDRNRALLRARRPPASDQDRADGDVPPAVELSRVTAPG